MDGVNRISDFMDEDWRVNGGRRVGPKKSDPQNPGFYEFNEDDVESPICDKWMDFDNFHYGVGRGNGAK